MLISRMDKSPISLASVWDVVQVPWGDSGIDPECTLDSSSNARQGSFFSDISILGVDIVKGNKDLFG